MLNSSAGALTLLPFHFKRLDDSRHLIVNLNGEYATLSNEEFDRLLTARSPEELGALRFPLLGKHFVAEGDPSLAIELLAVKMRSKKAYMKDFTSLHMMVVTARCNCVCDYCQASCADPAAQGLDMTPEIAGKAVDIIFQSPSPGVKIEFQGGEPTLNWPVVRLIVEKAEAAAAATGKDVAFVLCSNLFEAKEEWADFCRKHGISISTSLDGPEPLHDLHRKSRCGESSHARLVRNLAFYRERVGPNSCCALLTITRDNLGHLREVVDHYRDMGFRSVFLRGLNPYGFAVKNHDSIGYSVEEFLEAYTDALDYIVELNAGGAYFAELYAELLLMRILTPFSTGFVDLQSPAGAGISGAVYNYDGSVYPADEGRMLARVGDDTFLMGNVLRDTHAEMFGGPLIRRLVRQSCVETLPVCASCVYQPYCGADPIRYHVECGDIRGRHPGSEFCKKNKGIFDHLFRKILDDNPKVMNVFWSWIQREGIRSVNREDS